MMRLMRSVGIVVSVLGLWLFGCEKKTEPGVDSPGGEPAATQLQDQGMPGGDVVQEKGLDEEAFVTVVASMRRKPEGARRIEDPDGSGKKIPNWITTLYRGEKVTVLEKSDEWMKVRASDDSEGWMKQKYLLSATGVQLAVVLDATKTFERPSFANVRAGKDLEPGTLLYVIKQKEAFSEVNYGWSNTWVKNDSITSDERELAAAKLLFKIRYMRGNKDEKVGDLISFAQDEFAESKVVKILQEEEMAKAAEGEAAGEEGKAAEAKGSAKEAAAVSAQ